VKKRYIVTELVIVLAVFAAIWALWHRSTSGPGGMQVEGSPPSMRQVVLTVDASGAVYYDVRWRDGRQQRMTPQQYAQIQYDDYRGRNLTYRLLNVESPIGVIWVAVGLGGQVLFTGRMVVQWLASEKSKRSVVPVSFWWMSLIGSTMLVAYFLWRWDPVGILGQAVGWTIYVRNLVLIYSNGAEDVSIAADPAPEAELPQAG